MVWVSQQLSAGWLLTEAGSLLADRHEHLLLWQGPSLSPDGKRLHSGMRVPKASPDASCVSSAC